MLQWLMTDATTVAKDVLELNQNRPEKQVYMSLPRPGVSRHLLCTFNFILRQSFGFQYPNFIKIHQLKVGRNRETTRTGEIIEINLYPLKQLSDYDRSFKTPIIEEGHGKPISVFNCRNTAPRASR